MFTNSERKHGAFGQFFEDKVFDSSVSRGTVDIRLGFLRKVYGILAAQLSFTVLLSSLIMFVPVIKQYMLTSILMPICALGTIGCVFGLHMKKNDYPANFILLSVFTVLESICVGTLVSTYDTWIVVQALALTTTIVLSLSIYTLFSKKDFSWLSATIFSGLWILFIGGILQIFIRSPLLYIGSAIGGAFLFSLFIIYDTHLIMHKLSAEEYILAVITLYLDIINLFMKILKILRYFQENERGNQKKKSK